LQFGITVNTVAEDANNERRPFVGDPIEDETRETLSV
jgi:hypothetical protein